MANIANTLSIKLDQKDFESQLEQARKLSKKHTDQIANSILRGAELEQKRFKLLNERAMLEAKGDKASKERIAVINKEIKATATLITAENRRISGLKKSNQHLTMSVQQEKQHTAALDKATIAKKKNAQATSNMTNAVVRHLRQIETMVIAYYALSRGFQATIGVGLEVNRMMEDNTSGIAALLSANTQMILSNGQVVDSYQKFTIGQQVAKKTMDELRKASIKTYATFPQLTEIFQQAIGQTLAMGDSFGGTTKQIISNTVKLSQRMSNIAGAIGMPMDRVREEIRSLLSGNASTDSLISTMIFGSPGEANKAIRMAKSRGQDGVTDMLNSMLEPFDALEGVDSYTRSLLQLEDAWSQAMMKMSEPIYDDLKDVFKDLAKSINDNSDSIAESFNDIYESAKTFLEVAERIGIPAAAVASVYALSAASGVLTASIIALTAAMRANPLILGVTTLATAAYNWDLIAEAVFDVADAIAEVVDKKFGTELGKNVDENRRKFEEFTKSIEDTGDALEGTVYKPFSITGNAYQEDYKVKQFNLLKKLNQAILDDDKALIKKLQKEWSMFSVTMAKELQTKIPIDTKYIAEVTKKNNKALEETIKINEDIEKSLKQIEQLNKRIETDPKNIDDYKKQIQELQKNIANGKARIAEIEQKALKEQTKALEKQIALNEKLRNTYFGVVGSEYDAWLTEVSNKMAEMAQNTAMSNEEFEKYYEALQKTNPLLTEMSDAIEQAKQTANLELDFNIDTSKISKALKEFNKISSTSKDWTAGLKGQAKNIANIGNAFSDLAKEQKAWNNLTEQQRKEEGLKNQHLDNQLGLYGNIAGAVANAAEEGSTAAKVAQVAQAALAITQGASAILNQGTFDPWTAVPRMVAMAATVSQVLGNAGISGGGGGGMSQQDIAQQKMDNIEDNYEPILNKFDRQIELLESIDKNGSAAALSVELARTTFQRDFEMLSTELYGGATNVVSKRIVDEAGVDWYRQQFESAEKNLGFNIMDENELGLFIDWETILQKNRLIQVMEEMGEGISFVFDKGWKESGLTAMEYGLQQMALAQDEFQGLVHEYAMSLFDEMDTLKEARETFKEAYDGITGDMLYQNEKIEKAFRDAEGIDIASYLQEQIGIIDDLESKLTDKDLATLLTQDPNKIQEQAAILNRLADEFGNTFAEGAKQALNYMDSIEIVSEAMATSRENIKTWEDNFKTEQELAQDLANTIGVTLADSTEELDALFIKLSTDTQGLTNAELELLEANGALIGALGQTAAAMRNAANIQYGAQLQWNNLVSAFNSQQEANRIKKLTSVMDSRIKALQNSSAAISENISEIKSSISDFSGILSSLESAFNSAGTAIESLMGSLDPKYGIKEFEKAMQEALSLRFATESDGVEKFAEAVERASSFVSAVSDSNLYETSASKRFAEAIAKNQFKEIQESAKNQKTAQEIQIDLLEAQIDSMEATQASIKKQIELLEAQKADIASAESGIYELIQETIAGDAAQIIKLDDVIQAIKTSDYTVIIGQKVSDSLTDIFDEVYNVTGEQFDTWLEGTSKVLDINNDGIAEAVRGTNELNERYIDIDKDGDGTLDIRLMEDASGNLMAIELSNKQIATDLIGNLNSQVFFDNEGVISAINNAEYGISIGEKVSTSLTDIFDGVYDVTNTNFSEWLTDATLALDINNDGILEAVKGVNALGEKFVDIDADGDGVFDMRLMYDDTGTLTAIKTATEGTNTGIGDLATAIGNWTPNTSGGFTYRSSGGATATIPDFGYESVEDIPEGAFTSEDVVITGKTGDTFSMQTAKDFVNMALEDNDPMAVYNEARKQGIQSAELDGIMGWDAGTAMGWVDAYNSANPNDGIQAFAEGGLVKGGRGGVTGLVGEKSYDELIVPLKNDPLGMNRMVNIMDSMDRRLGNLEKMNIKQTANSEKSLNTQRGMLSQLSA